MVSCVFSVASSSPSSSAWVIDLQLIEYGTVPSVKIQGAFRVGQPDGSWLLGCCTSRGPDASPVPRVGGRDIGRRTFVRRLMIQLVVEGSYLPVVFDFRGVSATKITLLLRSGDTMKCIALRGEKRCREALLRTPILHTPCHA
ncbi:hypothetical protein K469DRAFT_209960 [Zopfia rhizophila CBS 207.26]|uniref:Uncharacterized protein n=1 Tax=Zopfia rhizophila CBS 207.26 TaxID=1314779 RepID=A0A6A6DUK8_9PEZI|nr:hypothetical protein K469DRAFT_209960 [Zopfia rhizophila CBS 207.26]